MKPRLQPKQLDFAIALAETMLAKFYDAEHGGFWQSAAGAADLILRVKEDYDGAEPSGNSVAVLALLKLGAIAGRSDFSDAAEKSLRLFSARLQQMPQAMPYLLSALDFSLQEPKRVVVAGDPAFRARARSVAGRAFRLSAEQSRAGKCGRGRGIQPDAAGERRAGGLSLRRQRVPAADERWCRDQKVN